MGRNLTNLPISASFQYLTQISGSELTDGVGADIDSLNISASYATSASIADTAGSATTATSASHAVQADSAISSSYATTASFAENATTPTLQQVTTQGSGSTDNIILEDSNLSGGLTVKTSGLVGGHTSGSIYQTSGAFTLRVNGIGSGGDTSPDIVFRVNDQIVADFDEETINLLKSTDVTGAVTASAGFQGDLAGNVTGTADDATAVSIFGDASNADRKLVFVDDNPATGGSQVEQLRGDTSKSITYNPSTNILTVPTVAASLTGNADTATSASFATTASFAENVTTPTLQEVTDEGASTTNDLTLTNVSASGYISASEFIGDGSGLTGISANAFPHTGSAEITGSLGVTGSISQEGSNSIAAGATPRVVILASSGSSLTTTQPDNMAIIASKACSITSTNTNTYAGGIFGAQSSTFGTGEIRASVILGGASNTMNGKLCGIIAAESCTVGSYSNFVGGGFNIQVNGDKSAVLAGIGARVNGGTNNTILAGNGNQVNGSQNSIVAGSSNTIPSGVQDSAIIAGYNSDANHNRSVTIGGNVLQTSKDDEVVVPHLTISGSATGDVYALSISSNTASLDCGLGNMFTLEIDQQSDVHLDASNIQAGQTINLEVTHDATNSGSLSFSGDFEFSEGTAPTITEAASSKDILTFISFNTGSLQGTSLLNFS